MIVPNFMDTSGFNLYKETFTGNTVMPSLSSNRMEKEVMAAIYAVQNTLIKDIEAMFSGPFWSFMGPDTKFNSLIFPSMTVLV